MTENSFRCLFKHANDSIFIVDPRSRRFLDVNENAAKRLGYSKAELLRLTLEDIDHPESAARNADMLAELRTTGSTVYEHVHMRKDGTHMPVEISSCMIHDGNREVIQSIVRDITERKQAEQVIRRTQRELERLVEGRTLELSESERLLRDLYENAPVTYLTVGLPSGAILRYNKALIQLLGYRPKELHTMKFFDFFTATADGLAQAKRLFQQIRKARTVQRMEAQMKRKNGELVWASISAIPKTGKAEIDTEIRATVVDISDRKLAEEHLRHSEACMRRLLDSIGEGVFGVDLLGRCTFVNPTALRLLRYRDPAQLVGEDLHAMVHHTCRDGTACPHEECEIYKAFRENKSFYVDDEILWRADGTYFDVEYRSNPIYVEQQVVGAVVTFVDTTQRKQAEDKLRQAATVFENTDEGIIVANAERKIVAVNGAFTRISGYSAAEVLGENPNFQQSGVHNEVFYRDLWARLESDGQWRGEIWNRRKNGEIYPAWENISLVKNEHGRITNYVSVFSDISAIKESEQRLSHLAHHDALTGLANRLMLTANLDQTLEWAKRHNQKVALLYLDLDRFKIINDTLGHAYGDQLLQAVAKRLRQCVRAEDTVARLGGDEFTIILAEISNAEDAAKIAEKINRKLAKPIPVDDQELVTSASIGISIFPDDASNRHDLLKAADTAMYHAKERGRNTFRFYTAELTTKAFEHLSLERGLRRALENDEFELYYQPQVALDSGKIVGVEALIRWRHPKRGLLAPSTFIPIAEETGLINPIGDWVFRTACAEAKAWHLEGLPAVRLAINLSERQILSEAHLGKIHTMLQDLGLKPGIVQLDLEITERILQIAEQSVDILSHLKSWGIMLAIDDFGTGYSSLSRLKQLPIDTLKIDRSFVKNIPHDRDDQAIVKAIIAMGHGLKLNVIAEGAETEDQLAFLHEHGCDELQGYLFSEPVPAKTVRRLLKERRQLSLTA